jgi:hypothetical protein
VISVHVGLEALRNKDVVRLGGGRMVIRRRRAWYWKRPELLLDEGLSRRRLYLEMAATWSRSMGTMAGRARSRDCGISAADVHARRPRQRSDSPYQLKRLPSQRRITHLHRQGACLEASLDRATLLHRPCASQLAPFVPCSMSWG